MVTARVLQERVRSNLQVFSSLYLDSSQRQTCDPAMKQFLLNLDETNAFGKKFVLQDLDDTHLFIATDIMKLLQEKIDDLTDKLHFPMQEKPQ